MVTYYLLDKNNKRKDKFVAYSDIAAEYNTTRNAVAGKFYRAEHENNSQIITLNGDRIERVRSI